MNKIPILYLDDERENLENFEIFFERDYQVHLCISVTDAFELLQKKDIWIIISDQRMPEMTGIEFFEIIKEQHPDAIRIMLTAYTEEGNLLEAINRGGVYRYITKPWNKIDLETVLKSAVETARLKRENKILINELQEKVLALSHNEETLKNIFNSSSDGIVVMTLDQKIIIGNRALCEMLLYQPNELTGVDVHEFIHPSNHDLLEQRWSKLATNDMPIVEYSIVRRDGTVFLVEIKTRPISYEGQLALLSTVRDITEKKQFERQLYVAAVNAEERERERIARDLHDGIGPLLSTLKIYMHDLTKLAAPTDQHSAVEMANEIIAESILSVKEISNNVSPHILRNFGLCHAISNFIERLQYKTKINFHFQAQLNERIEETIEITLYRITNELINNTLKYANAQNIFLTIEKQNDTVHVQYSDDGCGFKLETIIANGRGLGLQNIQSRLRSIGGRLQYKTNPGEGVVVDIEIRL